MAPLGGAGTASAFLPPATKGRLLAFDKDAEAVRVAQARFDDRRFSITHGSFADIPIVVGECDLVHRVDGPVARTLACRRHSSTIPTRGFKSERRPTGHAHGPVAWAAAAMAG